MDARTPPRVSALTRLLTLLVILGAINWGLIGFFEWNLVNALFGGDVQPAHASGISQLLYILVGLAGVALAFTFPWRSRRVTPETAEQHYGPRREVPS